ncbi:YIP1 family protein [Marinobacter sp. ATCH36]|uniref:YIP1 family protein n=1 Tax=Marinobacter sp. ATCH36 TaxID=2945106 RepID=UPI002021F667|nr:YIP1 family protein [Marinobacter sp. ATCH36]MCL7943487.1 YIP1 family protein [Marinobacter sp. ATCH36]
MNIAKLARLPFSGNGAWEELRRHNLSIPFLAWVIVVPMSFLPPVLLYYAGTHYGDSFIQGFGDKEWRFITTILFLAELLTFFVMGWLIQAVLDGHKLKISYQDAYLLAAIAPLPLWLSSLALLLPVLAVSVVAVFAGLFLSCALVYQGVRSLCHLSENDVVAMSATYTVMAASVLAWGVLMGVVWAF